MRSRRAVIYLVLVFVLGVAAGALGSLWMQKSAWSKEGPEDEIQGAVHLLTKKLDLSPEQQKQVEAILDETGRGYYDLYLQSREEYDGIRQQGRTKIRALLTEEQRVKFDEFVRRRDEREKKWMQRFEQRKKSQESPGENP